MPQLLNAGVRRFRVELVDEPANAVGPLLDAYRSVAANPRRAGEVWNWLKTVPDANGNAQGVTLGSLVDKQEIARDDLKLTKTRVKEQRQQEQQQQEQRQQQRQRQRQRRLARRATPRSKQ